VNIDEFQALNLTSSARNTPNKATGRVGAVGQINLICNIIFKKINGN